MENKNSKQEELINKRKKIQKREIMKTQIKKLCKTEPKVPIQLHEEEPNK